MQLSRTSLFLSTSFVVVCLISSASLTYLNIINDTNVFFNSTLFVRSKYNQVITPDEIIFTIVWPLIFLWNGVGVSYIAVGACLSSSRDNFENIACLAPTIFLVPYGFSFLMNIGWLFTYDAQFFPLSLAFLILTLVFLISSQVILYHHLESFEIKQKENEKDLPPMFWIVRVFVENGICLYWTWTFITVFLDMLNLVVYKDSFIQDQVQTRGLVTTAVASYIGLGFVFLLMLGYFFLEHYFWEKYLRYCIAVYPMLILYFTGIILKITRISRSKETDTILTVTLAELAFCLMAFVLRVVLFARARTRLPKLS